MPAINEGAWQITHNSQGVTLTHSGRVIMQRLGRMRPADASRLAGEWWQQVRAGLVEPVPMAEQVQRAAAAPLRPRQAQELDTAGLPLFGDSRQQLDLVELLR